MELNKKSEEFYKKLKTQLTETSSWPAAYLYKFIVATDPNKLKTIETVFDNMGAVIKNTPSKNGKYTSVSVNVRLASPDAVIAKYKEIALKVEGVISL